MRRKRVLTFNNKKTVLSRTHINCLKNNKEILIEIISLFDKYNGVLLKQNKCNDEYNYFYNQLDKYNQMYVDLDYKLNVIHLYNKYIKEKNNVLKQDEEFQKIIDIFNDIDKSTALKNNKVDILNIPRGMTYDDYKKNIIKAADVNKVFYNELCAIIDDLSQQFPIDEYLKHEMDYINEIKDVKKNIKSLDGKCTRRLNKAKQLDGIISNLYNKLLTNINDLGFTNESGFLNSIIALINVISFIK